MKHFFRNNIFHVAILCAISLTAEGKSTIPNLFSGINQNHYIVDSKIDSTSESDYIYDWSLNNGGEESFPEPEMVKAGTSMSVSANISAICSGQSVNITWTFNRGTIYPGTAEYSTNGSTWIALGTTSPKTITFSPTSTTTYYGRVRSTTNPVGTFFQAQRTVTVYSTSSSTPTLLSPANYATV
ncbi:MAG: hypothetical protein WC154_08125, partial [Candidatus Izemoplasmatales bacterium]